MAAVRLASCRIELRSRGSVDAYAWRRDVLWRAGRRFPHVMMRADLAVAAARAARASTSADRASVRDRIA